MSTDLLQLISLDETEPDRAPSFGSVIVINPDLAELITPIYWFSPARSTRTKIEANRVNMADLQSTNYDAILSTQSIAAAPTSASIRSPRVIKELKEPESSRKLPKSEQILILSASKFNGEKFPPWTREIGPQDFVQLAGEAMFREPTDMSLSKHQKQNLRDWARAPYALPPPSWCSERDGLFPAMVAEKPIDLVQDAASDCSVVASLCAERARVEKGHQSILSKVMFPYSSKTKGPAISPNGKYMFRFNFNGCYRLVVVDDRLPVSKSKRILHIIDRNNPCLLWPALVEKAYLKVRGGYDFPGSNSNTDLWIIAGWIPEQVFLQHADSSAWWKRMCNGFQYGDVLITMGTGKMSRDAEKELGLAAQHDYAVLDLKEDNGQQLVLLKNPWCEATLWKDAPALDDPALDNYLPAASSDKKLAPGTFWMSLNDIFQHFESIYLNWNPGMFKHRQDIHFGWDLAVRHQSSTSFIDNPQFSLSSKRGGLVWLLLCRHFQDLPARDTEDGEATADEASLGHISLYAFSSHGERVPINNATGEHSPYVDSPQILLRLDMTTNSTLTIVVSEQDLPRAKQNFTLIAYSIEPVELSQATIKYTHSVSVKSCWAWHTAGGSLNSPKFATNPQFRLDVSAPTTIAMLLETCVLDRKVNAKLCHSRGLRVHALRRQDILLDSHEYRSGSDFSELTAPLDAGTYTIVASTFEQGQVGDFALRIDAQAPIKLVQLASEEAGKFREKLPKAIFGGADKKLVISMIPMRMLKVSAVVTFASSYYPAQAGTRSDGKPTSAELIVKIGDLLADKPEAASGVNRTRCPVRISMQIGHGPHARQLAFSCSGEFSDDTDAGVRLPEVSLNPEMMRGHELFLVLERLGGGVDGSEERYWVEMLIDGGVGGGLKVHQYGWRRWDD